MNAAAEVREARLRAGLSIRSLARLAQVAPSTVWRIEHGLLSPTVRTLNSVLEATLPSAASKRKPREQHVSLALGRLAASALLVRPEETLEAARRRVAAQLDDPSVPHGARQVIEGWRLLLDQPIEEIVRVLIEPSERAHELRTVMPIVGTHTDTERVDAIRRARRAA